MSQIKIAGKTNVCGMVVPKIYGGFGEGKKSLLIKTIAEMHGKKTMHVNEAINSNRSRFIEMVDVIDLKRPGYEEIVIDLVDNNILSKMEVAKAESIYIASERGYAKLLKIFDDELAWDKYEEILDGYFREQEHRIDIQMLSPEMQMFNHMFQAVAKTQIELVETRKELTDVKTTINTIQDTFTKRDEDWRKSMNSMITSAAYRSGGNYRDLRSESYRLLEDRARCDLNTRLRNLKDRIADTGATKSKIESMTRMDVIEADPKLKEIYTMIVKEISIGSLKVAK